MHLSFAQSKNKKGTATKKGSKTEKKEKKDSTVLPADTLPARHTPADTVIVIDPKTGKAKDVRNTTPLILSRKPDTVIIIDPKTGKPKDARKAVSPKTSTKPDTIIYIDNGKPRQAPLSKDAVRTTDTVIVIKSGKQKKELQTIPKDIPKAKIITVPPLCNCIALKLKAPDTLNYNEYVNYSFIFKNNCKETIWINSASFGFGVSLPDGSPVKTLRKLQFIKQYKYPDFVPLSAGEEYSFDFGDDPFFQYDLHTNWQYKFNFTYYNTSHKYKGAPNKTYLCTELRDKTIVITDRPKGKK